MFLEKLVEDIFSHPDFLNDYQKLVDLSLSRSVGLKREGELSEDTYVRLLNVAIHFASADNSKFRKISNEIAVHVSKIDQHKIYANPLSIIWAKLGNFPTKRFILANNADEHFSLGCYLRNKYRELENSVSLKNKKDLLLTDFQAEVWRSLEQNPITTITAPTSAGKSFSLMNYLINEMSSTSEFVACYIVPTRALINQVTSSLVKICNEFDLKSEDFLITSVPTPRWELKIKKVVYVITQERLQVLFDEDPEIEFDFIIIDEAQMVGDSSRGVILHSMIEQVRQSSPHSKVLFGSPFTKNPSIFEMLLGDEESSNIVQSHETPVLQNLLLIDSNQYDNRKVKISRLFEKKIRELGIVDLGIDMTDSRNTLAYIAFHFGKGDRNLIYVDGPSEGERISSLISQLKQDSPDDASEEIMMKRGELSKFLKEHIHPNYILSETVLNGVAFHYGNMPTVVRKTIEMYFDNGVINYLVCTSTLLHGVNFPAKNLFIEKPEKGNGQPIASIDFWNLAGRAGRLGKDYEGNVFLIDLNSWKLNPLEEDPQQEIKPSYYNVLSNQQAEMFAFMSDSNHSSGNRETDIFETSFQKLLKDKNEENLEKNLLKIFTSEKDNDVRAKYTAMVSDIAAKVTLPASLYQKHSNISVFRQQELYDYLVHAITKKGPDNYILKHPMQEKSYETYVNMLRRIRLKVEKSKGMSELYFGPLMMFWMNGTPLAQLIKNYHEQKLKKSKTKRISISTSIRECLEDVEKDLRFRFVKFTRCYTDILALAFQNTGNQDLIKSIPNISLYLELGASSKSMVNLIGIGLSRTTASIVNEKMAKKDMDQIECIMWLRKNNLHSIGIPEICIEEIKGVIQF